MPILFGFFSDSEQIIDFGLLRQGQPQSLLRMRCTLNFSAIPIIDCLHGYRQVPPVRLHDLDLIPLAEFIPLRDPHKPLPMLRCKTSCHLLNNPQINIFIDIRVGIIDLRILIRLPEIESGCELAVRALGYL